MAAFMSVSTQAMKAAIGSRIVAHRRALQGNWIGGSVGISV